MKRVSTVAAQQIRNFSPVKLTTGLELRDRSSCISKEGDPYLRTLLVQGAQHIQGSFGVDCDLRRWGLKLAERGGRAGRSGPVYADSSWLVLVLFRGMRVPARGAIFRAQRVPKSIYKRDLS